MDDLERATLQYLQHLQIGEVQFEPLGRDTFPDFLIEPRIVVEATRLITPAKTSGQSPDTRANGYMRSLENALNCIQLPGVRHRIYVDVKLDVDDLTREHLNAIKKTIAAQDWNGPDFPQEIRVDEEVRLTFLRSSAQPGPPFQLGWFDARHQHVWIVQALIDQCAYALARKKEKLDRIDFDHAWLAVGGTVMSGLSDESFTAFKQHFRPRSRFSKLLLIDLGTPSKSRAVDLVSPGTPSS